MRKSISTENSIPALCYRTGNLCAGSFLMLSMAEYFIDFFMNMHVRSKETKLSYII